MFVRKHCSYTASTYKIIKFDTNKILYVLKGLDIIDVKKRLNTDCVVISSSNKNYFELIKLAMLKNDCIILENINITDSEIDLLINLTNNQKYNIVIKSVNKMNNG